MSRFSAEPWRLTLGERTWRLARAGDERIAPVEGEPAAALAGLGWPEEARRGALAVEFADAWLRYIVIEWPAGLKGGSEREAWAAERMRSVHGVGGPEWAISVDRGASGDTALACAAPRTLVDAVARLAAERRLRITAMQGSFVTVYNRLLPGSHVGGKGACGALGVCREGRLTLGLWAGGQWRRIRSANAGGDVGAMLGRMLPGLATTIGDAAGAGVLHVLGAAPQVLPEGWSVQVCEGAA